MQHTRLGITGEGAINVYKLTKLPSTASYVAGLTAIRPQMNDTQLRLLVEQYHAPRRTVTATQLAKLAEVRGGHPAVNVQYGRLGHMFANEIDFDPDIRPNGTARWWAMWSLGYSTTEGFLWEMLPEVAEALETLGWVESDQHKLPEEVRVSSRLVEGAVRRIVVNAYERNRAARAECIAHYGSSCVICSFDFGTVYGPTGKGLIHVHHLRPLSDVGEEYEIDPVNDLRPVCANCHAIIHRQEPPHSIGEVRSFLHLQVDAN